jgi:hypothetical protein
MQITANPILNKNQMDYLSFYGTTGFRFQDKNRNDKTISFSQGFGFENWRKKYPSTQDDCQSEPVCL